ncbi:MAG: hypothetical protein KDC12_07145 [Flavobacteriales bacterium]|nr:hypothetical protein [Flavobacteriales bacterium]
MVNWFLRIKQKGIIPAGIFLIGIVALAGCKKEKDGLPIDLGYDYFPNKVGTYIEYEVDSIHYGITNDTLHFMLREELVNEFVDLQGHLAIRLHRYKKFDPSDDWTLTDVWVQKRTSTSGERVEENVRFVRMVFPIDTEPEWDGNGYNTYTPWMYHYEGYNTAKNINGFSFSSTVTVDQRYNINLLDQEIASEIYAKGVGLVYKKFMDLTYQNLILEGVDMEWVITDYGYIQ